MGMVAVTGASGFIGRELIAVLQSTGHDVCRLGRNPSPSDDVYRWSLGEELPSTCVDVDAIVHLASAAIAETRRPDLAAQADISGTQRLIDQTRRLRQAGRRIRFIFLSSQSARPNALNHYGRSKWAIERILNEPDEIVVRPGLVYGDRPESVFGLFDRLSRLLVVPVVSARASIQPIHVRELAECIAQLVTMRDAPKLAHLGASDPLTFGEAIRQTARRAGRAPPITIRMPVGPVRLAARCADRVFGLRLTERLDGLTGLEAMDAGPSLTLLRRTLTPFAPLERGR
jgi:nucleoside-diphosphate-sugar epimerase